MYLHQGYTLARAVSDCLWLIAKHSRIYVQSVQELCANACGSTTFVPVALYVELFKVARLLSSSAVTLEKLQMSITPTHEWNPFSRRQTWGNMCVTIWNDAAPQRPDQPLTLYGLAKYLLNTLRPRQIGRHFADNIFKCIFLNENAWIALKISLKFVP